MRRRTAAQKVTQLELLLGQIANYCPIISRNIIVKNSTSIPKIWQAIRAHFGFQTSGSHFLDFNSICLEPDERPEDVYQRLVSFVEDDLLTTNGSIRHHGENITSEEDVSPTLENLIVLTWLRLIHPSLPTLVRLRYGTELRTQTLASIKPEISQTLGSLLDEIHSNDEAKVLCTAFRQSSRRTPPSRDQRPTKPETPPNKSARSWPLCKQASRPSHHFLSKCPYLTEADRLYLARSHQVQGTEPDTPTDDSRFRRLPACPPPLDKDCNPMGQHQTVSLSQGFL